MLGAVLWTAMPWVQRIALGTRPYVATAYDVVACAGWLLMVWGLVGFRSTFRAQYGRLGRVGVWTTGVGMALVAVVLARAVVAFVDAGFRAVPATGEDPAGLVVTITAFLGLGVTLTGAGVLGVALRRLEGPTFSASLLLVGAAVVPALVVGLRFLSLLPLALGMLVVRTPLVLVPFGVGWLALGRLVWTVSRHDRST
ncbi:hypothetical protein SAMN04487948_104191 [Halogranum amylolyticum]|uniref:Uncharacterized protein n=2 Tax=Halogranum amylolyticum TaxID=660520 RepID=A0A1H8RS38_9EURY|nr:hypothetical protein SAMN04487948_104191 [Halogranum amylolyticum]